jgi:hypothetical protein
MMQAKIKPTVVAAIMLVAMSTGVEAASISLTPNSTSALIGQLISLDINMDFRDAPTLGGGIDVTFNPALLRFDGFVAAPLGDPSLANAPTLVAPGVLSSLGFADFGGLTGPALVGTLTFAALALGNATISLAADVGGAYGPFFSFPGGIQQVVSFAGTTVDIAAVTVPIPASLPLLLSAVGVSLLGKRRHA